MSQRSFKHSAHVAAKWSVRLRFGIEAAAERAALRIANDSLDHLGLALRHEPNVIPHGYDRWVVTADLDLTHLQNIEPDNAATRLSYVAGKFPAKVLWTSRVTEEQGTFEWPPSFWDRRSGEDDHLLHAEIRAVRIEVSSGETKGHLSKH